MNRVLAINWVDFREVSKQSDAISIQKGSVGTLVTNAFFNFVIITVGEWWVFWVVFVVVVVILSLSKGAAKSQGGEATAARGSCKR